MKRTALSTFFALLFALNISAKSVEANERITLSFNSPGVVMVKYVGSNNSFPKLYIHDSNRNLVHSEVVTNKVGIAKLYNLKTLPEGEYTFKVVDKDITAVKSIVYKRDEAVESKPLQVDLRAINESGKLTVTCKNVDNKIIQIVITNKLNDHVVDEQIDVKKDFTKTYDFSKTRENNLIVKVISGSHEVVKEVSLSRMKTIAAK